MFKSTLDPHLSTSNSGVYVPSKESFIENSTVVEQRQL
jgi:hypothetical protein